MINTVMKWSPLHANIDSFGHTPRSVIAGSRSSSTVLQRTFVSVSIVAEQLLFSLTVQAVSFVLAPFPVFISCILDNSCSDWDGMSPGWEL